MTLRTPTTPDKLSEGDNIEFRRRPIDFWGSTIDIKAKFRGYNPEKKEMSYQLVFTNSAYGLGNLHQIDVKRVAGLVKLSLQSTGPGQFP